MISSKQTTSHFYDRPKYVPVGEFKVNKDSSCNLPVNEHKRPNSKEVKDKKDKDAVAIVEVMSEISHDALP